MENLTKKTIKAFRISKAMYGKGIIVEVPTQGFRYDHDAAFQQAIETDNSKERKHKVDRATQYSMTKGYPSWVRGVVISIETGKLHFQPKVRKAKKVEKKTSSRSKKS